MFETSAAVALLAALAHPARLDAFRVLVRAGPDLAAIGTGGAR